MHVKQVQTQLSPTELFNVAARTGRKWPAMARQGTGWGYVVSSLPVLSFPSPGSAQRALPATTDISVLQPLSDG